MIDRGIGDMLGRIRQLETEVERLRTMQVPVKLRARSYHNTTQSIATATTTTFAFNTTRIDSGGITGSSVLTAVRAGWWHGALHLQWAFHATGTRDIWVNHQRGGTTTQIAYANQPADPTFGTVQSLPFAWECLAGDYFWAQGYQNSGVALNVISGAAITPEFWVEFVG